MPLENEARKDKEYPIICVHGAAGNGKTLVGGTLSRSFVMRPPAERTSLITLEDLYYLQFDKDGVQTLHSAGLDPYYADYSNLPWEAASWIVGFKAALDKLPKRLAELNTKYLIVDAVSTLATYLDVYFVATAPGGNAQLGYGRSAIVFKELMTRIKSLPVAQVWLCHSRSAFVDDKAADKEAQTAQNLATKPGDFDVDLDLVKGNAKWFRTIPSLTVALTVEPDGKRLLVTEPGHGFYTKNRFGSLIKAKEEPDLRAILNKVALAETAMRTTGK
jgi:hypothetical protein